MPSTWMASTDLANPPTLAPWDTFFGYTQQEGPVDHSILPFLEVGPETDPRKEGDKDTSGHMTLIPITSSNHRSQHIRNKQDPLFLPDQTPMQDIRKTPTPLQRKEFLPFSPLGVIPSSIRFH